jgi:hypothetical protein
MQPDQPLTGFTPPRLQQAFLAFAVDMRQLSIATDQTLQVRRHMQPRPGHRRSVSREHLYMCLCENWATIECGRLNEFRNGRTELLRSSVHSSIVKIWNPILYQRRKQEALSLSCMATGHRARVGPRPGVIWAVRMCTMHENAAQ